MSELSGKAENLGLDEYQRLVALSDERRHEEVLARGRLLLEKGEAGFFTRAKTHHLLCWLLLEWLRRPCSEAHLHALEALHLARTCGDAELEGESLLLLGHAQFYLGDFGGAHTAYHEALALLEKHPTAVPHGQVLVHLGLGRLAAARGEPEEALAIYQRVQPLAHAAGRRFFVSELRRHQVVALLQMDRVQEAQEIFDRIEENVSYKPYTHWWKLNYRAARARLDYAAGRMEGARATLPAALALARELGDYAVAAECLSYLALMDQAEGRPDKAVRRARTAVANAVCSGRRDVLAAVRDRLRGFLGAI